MSLKSYKPTTPSRRQLVAVKHENIWKGRPHKALVSGSVTAGAKGRSHGRVTVRHRGGGHKRLYRFVDFKRGLNKVDVQRLEYDPNRSSLIALVKDVDSARCAYIIAPEGVSTGSRLVSGGTASIAVGNVLALKDIPAGQSIHNVELKIGKGAQIARSAGVSCQVMGRDGSYVLVRLPSGEVRKVHEECRATIGLVSNADHKNRSIGKAGRSRWMGIRPTVRGVAMNPVDHPMGGGEGRTSGGGHPVSPWGQLSKGLKTRNKNKKSSKFIVNRRKSGRRKGGRS